MPRLLVRSQLGQSAISFDGIKFGIDGLAQILAEEMPLIGPAKPHSFSLLSSAHLGFRNAIM